MATLDKGVINFDRVRPAVSLLRTLLRYVERKGIKSELAYLASFLRKNEVSNGTEGHREFGNINFGNFSWQSPDMQNA